MNKIELYKIYNFTVDAKFGDLPQTTVNEILKDGRAVSFLLANQLEVWFPSLTFVDEAFYDYVDNDRRRYECKCFTERGANIAPSSMQGGNRKLNFEKFVEIALNNVYILPDIRRFPEVNVIFVEGSYLLKNFTKDLEL